MKNPKELQKHFHAQYVNFYITFLCAENPGLSSYHDPKGLKGKIIICLLTTYFIKVHSFKVGTIHTLFFRSTLVVMHIMLVACLAALVVGSSHLGLHPQSIFICIFFSFFFFFLFFSFSFNVGIR